MRVLRFLLQKEFRQIFRDKTILGVMLAVPVVQLIILPLAMDFDVRNINLVVVDAAHSTYSQQLISKIGASGYFRIVNTATTYKTALPYLEEEQADIILQIPPQFERSLVREGAQPIDITVDAINGTKAALGGSYLQTVLKDFNENIQFSLNSNVISGSVPLFIEVTEINWFNPLGVYEFYIVPGVLALLLMLVGGGLAALNIVREKEVGTIEQINVTPIQKWQFILGKLIPFWLLGLIVFTLGLVVSYVVYGIFPAGSFALLYLFAGVYLIAILGFGFLISTYSSNQLQAMFVALFFMMIFLLMSGLFTSVDSMPAWARTISNLTPITHFVKVMRMIVLKGSGWNDVKLELLYESAFAVVLNGWAILNYKKTS